MNRRRFLGATVLSAAAVWGAAGSAQAFSEQSCGKGAPVSACDELERHRRHIDNLKRRHDEMHLTPTHEQEGPTPIVCAVCGEP